MHSGFARVYRAAFATLAVVCAAGLAACGTAGPAKAQSVSQSMLIPSADDQTFIALREASRANNPALAAALAARIPDYPAPGYVEYYSIKPQMFDTQGHARIDAPDELIRAFLIRYDGSAIADRLRNDYLLVLGARHDWRTFNVEYPRFALDDDTQVKCYALEARAAGGQPVADAARALLVEPKNYGDACVDLVSALAANNQFSSDDVWFQLRLAYENNYVALAKRLADALGSGRPDDSRFDQAANAPALLLVRGIPPDPVSHQLALLAIIRAAANDPAGAAALFSSAAPGFTPLERGIGWGEIAYRAALKRQAEAVDWYRLSTGAPLSNSAYEWRVRAALGVQDWPMVRWAVESMPPLLAQQPAWVYWHARALKATGNGAAAAQEFAQISGNFDFYGQLATEELGSLIVLPPRTVVSPEEIDAMRHVPNFMLAQRFYALNLRLEGNREWNWVLRGMTDRQLLAVAAYAQTIPLYDRTVNTADRTRTEHDFSLRFVTPFRSIVERYAKSTGLDVEWAYGLIRQESRFIINARSGVGASGLMQLMPGTAKLVARKIGLGPLSASQANDIDTNIQLGTAYLSMIYDQFDGSAVLASAGYNAGPGRPTQWRAAFSQPVEGAIFAETIPFSETRDYVKNVLSNTVYYAALFEGRPQSLKARLGIVAP
ncbi:MAG: transglycosylase SLT domain-containing protein [Janthinobacterium lividum]